MNLLNKKLDIFDFAVDEDLTKLAELIEPLSDMAKNAFIPDLEDIAKLPDTAFALQLHDYKYGVMNKFACYNAELTELNMACLVENLDKLPEEIIKVAGANLTCSAKKFGVPIPKELEKYASDQYVNRLVNINKLQEKEISNQGLFFHKYALHGKYPIDTEEQVKLAIEWFDRNYHKLSCDEIQEFKQNILQEIKNNNYDVEIKTACLKGAYDFNPHLASHISMRKNLIPDNDIDGKFIYDDLYKNHKEFGLEKTAQVLELIDMEFGLNQYYGSKLVHPIDAVYDFEKKASETIDGEVVTLQQLRALDDYELTKILGSDGLKELKSDRGLEVLKSFPTPIRKEILLLIYNS